MRKMKLALSLVVVATLVLLAACGDDDNNIAPHGDESSTSIVMQESSSSETGVFSSSRKDGSSSSNVAELIGGPVVSSSNVAELVDPSTAVTGEMTDSRDGQTYRTVTIGMQTWMAQNLNYDTTDSWCYNDSAEYCAKYGRLYTWGAAKAVCPSGWHLPTKADFETLIAAVGDESTAGKALKSTNGWFKNGNGTDAYAFSALPAGYRYYSTGKYDNEGYYACFWSSTVTNSPDAYYMSLNRRYDSADLSFSSTALDVYKGYSVRCLKDWVLPTF
ncbi:fibrobacter succinogenes major paralogous domain-containing protein [Fibrobacter sp.]|uniref:fibrobacter succinogenes major paralogous domain-containing protein n=1 Tax=Fibrobacter sp. TaxID=35828 RepID=UPI002602B772|nr:fibrobacter succinogenes major paralogous domain-containing protein [Fibrobacter sp.]MDD5941876.1 fibrobacter succinogenes major paralogous domain-containing protein [Fibrobacter sp.]